MSNIDVILDPESLQQHKTEKRFRYNAYFVSSLRLTGFLMLSLAVALHNIILTPAISSDTTILFFLVSLGYGVTAWLIIYFFYNSVRRFDLGDLFLLTDVFLHLLAIYCSGGTHSFLIILLITRVADQAATNFRRVLFFTHYSLLCYLLFLLYLNHVEHRMINWPVEWTKLLLIYIFNLYLSFTAKTAEYLRTLNQSAIRRAKEELVLRKETEEKLKRKHIRLQNAFAEIKVLRGIVPICSFCKKIRDDKGYWNQLEAYIREHSEAEFSHGICPECMKKYYSDYDL